MHSANVPLLEVLLVILQEDSGFLHSGPVVPHEVVPVSP